MKRVSFRSNVSVMPLFIAILILLSFGLYYLRHKAVQQEYFRDRNLRQLRLISDQFAARLENIKRVVRNTPATQDSFGTYSPRRYLKSVGLSYVDSTLNELPWNLRQDMSRDGKATSIIYLPQSQDTTWLQFADIDPMRQHVWTGITGRIDIRDIIEPLISENVFDEFLVLGPTGMVVYQKGDIDVQIKCLDSLRDATGIRIGLEQGQKIAGVINPVLAETEYKLFFQPISLPIQQQGAIASKLQRSAIWTICGLVLSEKFDRETRELSYTLLIIAVMLIVLVSLSWPLLKLWFIGKHGYATRTDLYLVVLALLLGSGLLTFIVLDAIWVQGGFRSDIDIQLQEYSDSINDNFKTELGDALTQLRHYVSIGAKIPITDQLNDAERSKVSLFTAEGDKRPDKYKAFEFVYWVNGDGDQTMKWTTKKYNTRRINVAERNYFKDVKEGKVLHAMDSEGIECDFAIEPHYSWTSNAFRVALSMRDREQATEKRLLVGMDMMAISVAQTVSPPGFGFCIINDNGDVLFHSRPERALRENLFNEVDPDKELRSAIFARSAEHINARYWGVDHRLYVKPIAGLPWSIVVFREKTALWTMNIQILTGATVLFGTYLFLPLMLIFLLSKKRKEIAPWLWPSHLNTLEYRQLTVFYGFTACVLFFVQRDHEHLLHALGSMLLLSLLVIALTYVRLNDASSRWYDQWGKKRTVLHWLAFPFLIIGLVSLVWMMNTHGVERSNEWVSLIPHVLFDLCLFGIGVVLPATPFSGQVYKLTPNTYKTSYVVGNMTFIVLTSILPAFFFFKISYDVQAELFVKHAQLQLGRALQERAVRIDKTYLHTDLPEPRESTLKEFRDDPKNVYAGFFFKTNWSEADGDSVRRQVEDDGRNWLFEVIMAPYNESSVEMRDLLSDSSHDASFRWRKDSTALVFRFGNPGATRAFSLTSNMPRFGDVNLISWRGLLLLAFLAGLFVLTFIVVQDIGGKLFLINLMEPHQRDLSVILKRPLSSSILLLNVAIESIKGALGSRAYIIDLAHDSWDRIWLDLDKVTDLPSDRVIVVHHCEHRMHDSAENRKKLKLLESLMIVHTKNMILTSQVDPLLECNLRSAVDSKAVGGDQSDQPARWRIILGLCIRLPIGGTMQAPPSFPVEGVDSTGPYYQRMWHACSEDERRVLVNVARGRFVSPRSHDVVKTLLLQGLLERKPVLKVPDKSFKRFLGSDERLGEVERYAVSGVERGWNAWKFPLMLLLVVTVLFLFITQREVLSGTMAFVSAATALLPALFRLIGMMTSGRAASGGNGG